MDEGKTQNYPSEGVTTPVVGIMMRRRERMQKNAAGEYEGFSAPRAGSSMPAYSLAADARKWDLPKADWDRHVAWMRENYDVKTLTLGIYDYLLSDVHMQAYVDWYMQPPYLRNDMDVRNIRAKSKYANARLVPAGVMYEQWDNAV